jgi:hypothetical protein
MWLPVDGSQRGQPHLRVMPKRAHQPIFCPAVWSICPVIASIVTGADSETVEPHHLTLRSIA